MLCSYCHHCGLCPGDKSFVINPHLYVQIEGIGLDNLEGNSSCAMNEIGIAIDIGTTTIACKFYRLKTAELLQNYSEPNQQIKYGSDVISRIKYGSTQEGLKELTQCIQDQISQIIRKIVSQLSFRFMQERAGRLRLSKIVFTGNTTMLSLLRGLSVKGFSAFPFTSESLFGDTVKYESLEYGNIEVYFPPAVSAFVGSDTVTAMLACGFNLSENKTAFLCDTGTNCEMALLHKGKLFTTSSSAGPAFEGQGIEMGMAAAPGAITKVNLHAQPYEIKVVGNTDAEGICGTGLLSICAELLRTSRITNEGTFIEEKSKFNITGKVHISQQDIRNFQLAKGAVYSGLACLEDCCGEQVTETQDCELYLAGGFGTKLNKADVLTVKMIPQALCSKIIHAGNAALSGAVMLLFDDELKIKTSALASSAVNVDLAQLPDFQQRYIGALNF